MELKKLDKSFYIDNPLLIQALDFDMKTKSWMAGDKVRGHGIVQIEVKGLKFAIPVRSNINHDESYILTVQRGVNRYIKGMGLDYSKALLIRDDKHVSALPFVLKSKDAGKKLQGKEEHVKNMFSQYVDKYIAAVRKPDRNILNSMEYRFTTLVNYHTELGLP